MSEIDRGYRPGRPLPPLSGDAEFQFRRIGRRLGVPMLTVARWVYDIESRPDFKSSLAVLDVDPDPENLQVTPYPIEWFYDDPIPKTIKIPKPLATILVRNSLKKAWLHMWYVHTRYRLERSDGRPKTIKELKADQEALVQAPRIQWSFFPWDDDEPDIHSKQWIAWFDFLRRGLHERLPTTVDPLPERKKHANLVHLTPTGIEPQTKTETLPVSVAPTPEPPQQSVSGMEPTWQEKRASIEATFFSIRAAKHARQASAAPAASTVESATTNPWAAGPVAPQDALLARIQARKGSKRGA